MAHLLFCTNHTDFLYENETLLILKKFASFLVLCVRFVHAIFVFVNIFGLSTGHACKIFFVSRKETLPCLPVLLTVSSFSLLLAVSVTGCVHAQACLFASNYYTHVPESS